MPFPPKFHLKRRELIYIHFQYIRSDASVQGSFLKMSGTFYDIIS